MFSREGLPPRSARKHSNRNLAMSGTSCSLGMGATGDERDGGGPCTYSCTFFQQRGSIMIQRASEHSPSPMQASLPHLPTSIAVSAIESALSLLHQTKMSSAIEDTGLTNSADRELVERLRAKYMGGGSTEGGLSDIGAATLSRAQLGAEASGSTDRVRTRAEGVEVKVCAKCEGTGQFVEIYGFRRLESTCADCCGRGCITYRHGVPVDDSGPGSDAAAPVDSAALAEQRKAKARRCAESCRAKITAYTAEREGALARMAATTDERERSLCADLLGQLEKAMADKQEQLDKMESLLKRYDEMQAKTTS